ncbi:hypothetical protein TRFO_18081 [Tritrichomonas foetus]|uniref:AAA+ ATPase domain-containing protein n=1 Tax=Tritrichomonas foetus TaxID=1144522 RepID=A0A1J4KMZ0_9EUKA|nr:hypothetical protein TRFO_18081 [Tritrichomonas foetus]|eukprot:OHT12264.1 hypothetical protein TRFO_18081 [Tritrichomonas foetus]
MSTNTIQLIVDRLLEPTNFHVYLHPTKMSALNITNGMIVRIRSRMRKTILASAYTGDSSIPVSTIRMSRCLRINLSAYLGQIVIVDAFPKCVPADSVTVAPIDDTVDGLSGNFQELFNANLNSLPMTPNFVIPIFTLHRVVEFKVISCTPANFVIVRNRDSIIVKNQTVQRAKDMQRFDSICYDDFGGIEPQLRDLRADIELPLLQSNIFETLGIRPFRGVLISAPSGCGKTQLSRAIQNETPVHFERIPGFDLLARNSEDASCIMRKLADRAIARAPSIVFVDELDLIIQDQYINGQVDKRLYLAFIAALDMMLARGNIVVIGATRDYNNIPAALKNVNRFGHIIEFPLPGQEKKMEILKKIARGMKLDNETLEKIAKEAKTGGDLEIKVHEELLNKAFELAGHHTQDDDPIPLSEIANIEFGANIPPSRESSSINGISSTSAGNRDSFGDLGPNITFKMGQNDNDPFSSIVSNNDNDPFNTASQPSSSSQKNPFSMNVGNDPFASNSQSNKPDMFSDPFGRQGGNDQIQDPFSSPQPKAEPAVKKPSTKKSGKIDPFAPRIKK